MTVIYQTMSPEAADINTTLNQCLKAARQGRAEACYDLGLLFSVGRDVAVDMIEAHKWFNIAVMKGVREAQACRAELAADMSAEEIAAAQRAAREWLETATQH